MDIYAKENKIPFSLQSTVNFYLKSNIENTSLEDSEKRDLLLNIPKRLRFHIAMSMHGGAASVIEFFKDKDKAFISNIVPLLIYRKYPGNKFIYHKGDYADEFYFLFSGKVSYLIGAKNVVFKSMIAGCHFGEIEVID
jgi:hypothetical protein